MSFFVRVVHSNAGQVQQNPLLIDPEIRSNSMWLNVNKGTIGYSVQLEIGVLILPRFEPLKYNHVCITQILIYVIYLYIDDICSMWNLS